MLISKIGIFEGVEPLECAASGEAVRGRHAVTYTIEGTNAYYRVLAKHQEKWDANPANHQALVDEYKTSLTPSVKKIYIPSDDKKEVK